MDIEYVRDVLHQSPTLRVDTFSFVPRLVPAETSCISIVRPVTRIPAFYVVPRTGYVPGGTLYISRSMYKIQLPGNGYGVLYRVYTR